MSTSTSFVRASEYSPSTPQSYDSPLSGVGGGQHRAIKSDGKHLVLLAPDCYVKPCVNSRGHPFLVLDHVKSPQLMAALEAARQRCLSDLEISEDKFRPLLSQSRSLIKRPPSYCLNMTPKATLKDHNRQPVEYESIQGKSCKMTLLVHLSSVFQNDEGMASLQVRVSQMMLQEIAPTFEVEQVELDEVEDIAELL